MFKGLAVLALAASVGCYFAVADGSSNVAKLTKDNFDESVGDGKVYFIKFFAPWCGHCKRLVPTWEELATGYKDSDKVVVAHVDCTVDKDVCSKAEVRGYPTLKVYQGGEMKEQYKGPREITALKEFVEKQKKALLEETTE